MNIKTITCHDVYNYGASLQAYALQAYLSEKGHHVEIIDYFPEYLDVNYRIRWEKYSIPVISSLYPYRKVLGVPFLYKLKMALIKLLFIIEKRGRKKAFDKFKREQLSLTPTRFKDIDELRKAELKADLFIAGSDQIWNPAYNNGKDPAYFLQFGEGKKISYAASFGVSKLEESDKSNIYKWLKIFDRISVREATGLVLLKELNYTNGVQVCDPVFLLDKKEWKSIASRKYPTSDRIILVYNLGPLDKEIQKCAQTLAKTHNLPIFAIEERSSIKYADKQIKDAGPCEFIELFSKASYVVTNSFHATSFSLIFNIPFYTYIKNNTSSRIADLLKKCALEQRLNSNDFHQDINWIEANNKISLYKMEGLEFLNDI